MTVEHKTTSSVVEGTQKITFIKDHVIKIKTRTLLRAFDGATRLHQNIFTSDQ